MGLGLRWIPPSGSRVLVDLLHRVEVDGIDAAQRGQADLILPVLVRRLRAENTHASQTAPGHAGKRTQPGGQADGTGAFRRLRR